MVLQGLDVLEKHNFKVLKNKKIGLITNYSFYTKDMRSGLEVLFKNKIDVVKIFTPEHGLDGLPDGKEYSDSLHPKYNVPVISLYGKNKKPSREMFSDIDLLVYDIQDVGLRFYTFIYTLAYCLETANECKIDFLVLDRINPLGRKVFGNRIKKEFSSFVGNYELPLRYGLTPGEVALYIKKLLKLDINIDVVKNEGWNGEEFSKTDLLWNVPSPNLPEYNNTLTYSGMCFLEATNVSEGRGTTKPFLYIGAPWIDSSDMYHFLKTNFKFLKVRERNFVPLFSKHKDKLCQGIEFFPSEDINFTFVGIKLLEYFRKYPEYELMNKIERHLGNSYEKLNVSNIDISSWKKESEDFCEFCKDILLYKKELKVL